MKTYTIDAKNKILGRVASEVAALLRGKKEVDFAAHKLPGITVTVINCGDLKTTGNKEAQKEYTSYSGYPGGIKRTPISTMVAKKGMGFVLKKAVWGMLPKNTLRAKLIKNLIVK